MPDPHWTQIFSAVLLPLVASSGVVVAWKQWKLSREKINHDLFDKRFAVYDAARRLIATVGIGAKPNQQQEVEYLGGIREAKWLLNEDIAEYLHKTLWHKVVDLGTIHAMRPDAPGSPPPQSIKEEAELVKEIRAQYAVLDEKFAPFLQISPQRSTSSSAAAGNYSEAERFSNYGVLVTVASLLSVVVYSADPYDGWDVLIVLFVGFFGLSYLISGRNNDGYATFLASFIFSTSVATGIVAVNEIYQLNLFLRDWARASPMGFSHHLLVSVWLSLVMTLFLTPKRA